MLTRTKLLLAALLFLTTKGFAASTDTVTASTEAAPAEEAITFLVPQEIPVEQKVVELHITPTKEVAAQMRHKRIENFDGQHATCSGAFVDSMGDIITARHCTEVGTDIEVVTADRRSYKASIVSVSETHDLALLHIDKFDTPHFKIAPVTRGETIYVLGSPLAITDVLTVGTVARLDGDLTLIDCTALPGNSGGPVFNEKHQLVGVLTGGFIVMFGTTHLNIAQSSDAVWFFLMEAAKKAPWLMLP